MAIFERMLNYYWRYTHFSLNHDDGRKGKLEHLETTQQHPLRIQTPA